jgi:hypothetical protein
MRRWCYAVFATLGWLSATAASRPVDLPHPTHLPFAPSFQPVHASGVENALWGDEFNLPFANGTVCCAIVFQGDLIVGGNFTCIDGKPISYLARWDGTDWTAISPGIDGPALTFFQDGSRVLVGGSFSHAGGHDAVDVAAWDGASWEALVPIRLDNGGGSFHGVFSIQRFQGELMVAGEFRSDTNPDIEGIARLHEGEWQPVAGGVHGRVRALATFRDTLYVGGDFDSAGAVVAAGIAKLDGSQWVDIGGVRYGDVVSLATYHDRLYVGGYFQKAGNVDVSCLATWDGSAWGAPVGVTTYVSGIYSLWVDGDRLDIGHYFGVDFWDGATLTFGPILFGGVYALTSQANDLFIGGSFTSGGTSPIINIGRWDGVRMWGFSTWASKSNGFLTELGSGGGPMQMVSYRGSLVVLGGVLPGGAAALLWYYGTPNGLQEAAHLMFWDGTGWTPVEFSGTPFNGLPSSIAATAETLYVAGNFADRAQPSRQVHVLAFDGQSWVGLEGLNAAVKVMAVANDVPYVSTYVAGSDFPHIYRWVGGAWEDIGELQGQDTVCNSVLGALGEFQGKLVAIGSFTSVAGIPAHGAAVWDGSQWQPMGAGTRNCFRSDVTARTAQFQGRLVVPTYSCDCSGPAAELEAWDGQQWTTIDGPQGWVTALAAANDKLYVSGISEISSWNGLRWEVLQPSPNGQAVTIAPHGNDVYFGGDFSSVGSKGSFGIARLIGVDGAPPTEKVWLSPAAPNPTSTWSDFSIHIKRSGSVRVAVHDVRGRELAVLHKGEMTSGYHAIRWDGRDRTGKITPAGIYFLSVESPDGLASGKVVRLK